VYRVLVEKIGDKNHSEYSGVDGRIIFTWIFRNWNGGHGSN